MSGSSLSSAEIYYKICQLSGFRVFITRSLVTQQPLFDYKIVAYTIINIFIVPGSSHLSDDLFCLQLYASASSGADEVNKTSKDQNLG